MGFWKQNISASFHQTETWAITQASIQSKNQLPLAGIVHHYNQIKFEYMHNCHIKCQQNIAAAFLVTLEVQQEEISGR